MVFWGVGVRVFSFGKIIGDCIGVELDWVGWVVVNLDLSVVSFDNIFVLGDLVNYFY